MRQSTIMSLQLDLETVVVDEVGSVGVLAAGVRVLVSGHERPPVLGS